MYSYGSLLRTLSLPAGADEDDGAAWYDKGILTVSVAVTDSQTRPKAGAIRVGEPTAP